MRGPKPQYPIELTNKEAEKLNKLIKSHTAAQGKVKRAKIIVAAHEHPDWSNQQIAEAAECTDRMVRKWRRRWCETKSLEDLPRPGAPRRFSP